MNGTAHRVGSNGTAWRQLPRVAKMSLFRARQNKQAYFGSLDLRIEEPNTHRFPSNSED